MPGKENKNIDKELEVQEKTEVAETEEQTVQGRSFKPATDIYESTDALVVVMEVPGVDREHLKIHLDKDQLSVVGSIDVDRYASLNPQYTEYNVGNFSRSFQLPSEVDRGAISASVADGVLSLRLPKHPEETVRSITVE